MNADSVFVIMLGPRMPNAADHARLLAVACIQIVRFPISGDLVNLERQMAKVQTLQIEMLGGLVNIQSYGAALLIHIHYN